MTQRKGWFIMTFEIWLGNDFIQFERGLAHFDDGSTKDLFAWHNSSSYHVGSVLVGGADSENEDYPLRWYPYPNVIEFYDWDAEISEIIFHNNGDRDIYIFGYAYLKSGETVTCVHGVKKNGDYVRRWTPIAFVTLKGAPEQPELIGSHGLLLERMSADEHSKVLWKFITVDFLSDNISETTGFITEPGIRTFEDGVLTLNVADNIYSFVL